MTYLTGHLHKDETANVTVGYTTDVEAVSSIGSGTLTPVLSNEHLKTITVTGDFTLGAPAANGHAEFYITATGVGPWTITEGTNVSLIGGIASIVVGTNYILNVRRYSSTITVAQLVEI